MSQPFVIIGGDAAGMSAASKIKRDLPDADVIVFERGQVISYSACGMPYWIAGTVASDQQLIVLTPERARRKRGIDVRIGHEVLAIDRASKNVTVLRHATGEQFTQPYHRLLIATGARALKPPIPGIDQAGIFTLRSLADAQQIVQYLTEHQPQSAVVIGGGYIGLEMVEALRTRQLSVSVVEQLPQLLPTFDPDMLEDVEATLRAHEVSLLLSTRVERITRTADHFSLQLTPSDGTGPTTQLTADLIIVAAGVAPNSELAKAAGLRLGETGAIWVDDQMRTSDPAIFAAGDCVEHQHLVLGKAAWIPLAPAANKGGRLAGENMAGGNATFPGIVGTAVIKVFDYTVACTGLTEAAAKASGRFGAQGEFVGAATIRDRDRASYWPGVAELQVKIVFDRRDGRLLGGQIIGRDGVNKRIDILATALHAGMTVRQVGWLDLSYAPPYSLTWDPVQVAANVASSNLL